MLVSVIQINLTLKRFLQHVSLYRVQMVIHSHFYEITQLHFTSAQNLHTEWKCTVLGFFFTTRTVAIYRVDFYDWKMKT